MLVTINPPLYGIAAERFLAYTKQIERVQDHHFDDEINELYNGEIQWSNDNLHNQHETYIAAVRILADLARLNWKVRLNGYKIELESPSIQYKKKMTPEEILHYKSAVRRELCLLRNEQLKDDSVRKFIQRMEEPSPLSKQKSILNLIADGKELYYRLNTGLSSQEKDCLRNKISPYLQLVPGEDEEPIRDEYTGILLGDIWRYFRYTWSLPQANIPGRQLLYLIRDAAHPNHAVMGLLAFSNSAMQLKDRDNYIGWTFESWSEKIKECLRNKDASIKLQQCMKYLERSISQAIKNIETSCLVTEEEIQNPTPEIVLRLRKLSEKYSKLRGEALKKDGFLSAHRQSIQEMAYSVEIPPVSNEVLELEPKSNREVNMILARKMLIGKKRALELSRLLQARIVLNSVKKQFTDPSLVTSLLQRDDFRVAINTVLNSIKSSHIGTNMLELTTCGAVRPYSIILGGKLAALLALSPQIINDYYRRYGNAPSIISSQMKNKPVIRDARLVYIGTTSLYSIGSSQYERLRLPEGTISSEQKEIRYYKVGYTSGYGTVQFSPETVQAIEKVMETKKGYQDVNSVFGEGPSPKFRKISSGMDYLGFPQDLMRHNQLRIIYAVPLCSNARQYLLGEPCKLPDYICSPEKFIDKTESIVSFWRERWLNTRLKYLPSMDELKRTRKWKLSEILPVVRENSVNNYNPKQSESSLEQEYTSLPDELDFWRSIAWAGSNVCSDELDLSELEKLHIKSRLDDFIIEKVQEGFSIVLTGNAGDGKTHLLKRLKKELNKYGAVVQCDATAACSKGDVAPILEEWRRAINQDVPYCIATNEYPLYQLRSRGKELIPVLKEVDRQCRNRLAYGEENQNEEAKEKVLVIDLSLRNPLCKDFASAVLDKLLSDSAVKEYADSNQDPNFTRNFRYLKHPIVIERLLKLFERIVMYGYRATIRELWIIICRLLFGDVSNSPSRECIYTEWFSERLFTLDHRFPLSTYLQKYCDPAGCSHPRWDMIIENSGSSQQNDWFIENQEPLLSLSNNNKKQLFIAKKRAFYFGHKHGEEVFNLEDDTSIQFQKILTSEPDSIILKSIIGAINRCYCPISFNGCEDALYLWVGHRFHEKPTRSFLANQRILYNNFEILLPRLPKRVRDIFDYIPDHFLLRCVINNKQYNLKVDYSLFDTLMKLKSGVPRHLVPERDINRSDVFLEQLQSSSVGQERVFMVYNSEYHCLNQVKISNNWSKYEEVLTHE